MFGLIWFTGFKGEDLNVKVYAYDGRTDGWRRTTAAKWWQKLTCPLARGAKNAFKTKILRINSLHGCCH
jgi:hypothetical protein